jgi:hypothetical protein
VTRASAYTASCSTDVDDHALEAADILVFDADSADGAERDRARDLKTRAGARPGAGYRAGNVESRIRRTLRKPFAAEDLVGRSDNS